MPSTTRPIFAMLASFAIVAISFASGDDPRRPPTEPAKEQPKEKTKDFRDFSRILHRLVTASIPKMTEDRSQWGQTIPLPDKLILKNAQRTYIKVGDHLEVPHGPWRRTKSWFDDPAKDITLVVRDFKKTDAKLFRLSLDAGAAVHGEAELQAWSKGLLLLNVSVQADARFSTSMELDVAASFKTDVFPPALVIEPKVAECKITLNEFVLKRVGNLQIEGELGKEISNELRNHLQTLITQFEPTIKSQINEAIAQSLKEGKGPSLLELLSTVK